jgi:N-acetylglucosaminyldiphosphoundecaprenol N-acetyl-beta-D-mannosaminyltransferase
MMTLRPEPADQDAVGSAADAVRAGLEGKRPLRIVILSGDADANLGDRAILQAMVHELRSIRPTARIAVVSSPGSRLGVEVTEIRRGPLGFVKLCVTCARSDLVLCGGGGLFQDDDSLIKMPYWCLRVLLARLLSGRVVGYSLGVGPLRSLTSRLAARLAFAAMASVSARDPLAQHAAQSLTAKRVSVVPDPALLLPKAQQETVRGWLAANGVPLHGKTLIGVAVRRWFPPGRRIVPHMVRSRLAPGRQALSPESERLAALLGRVLDELIRRHDAHVLLMPSYGASHEGDLAMSRAVIASMSESKVQLLEVDEPTLYKGIASVLQLFLGGRMHPTIFAASTGTPVVGLSYNQKFQGFFGMLGLGHQVMDVIDFTSNERVEDLVNLASAALSGPTVSREHVDQLVERVRCHNRAILGTLP